MSIGQRQRCFSEDHSCMFVPKLGMSGAGANAEAATPRTFSRSCPRSLSDMMNGKHRHSQKHRCIVSTKKRRCRAGMWYLCRAGTWYRSGTNIEERARGELNTEIAPLKLWNHSSRIRCSSMRFTIGMSHENKSDSASMVYSFTKCTK